MGTIVCFHIGRGGRFWNPGHLSFDNYTKDINDYVDDFFLYHAFETEYGHKYKGYPNILRALDNFFEVHNDEEIDQATMDCYPIFKRLGLTVSDLGEYGYYKPNGGYTGLDYNNDGTGTIDIDGDYNTTYCKYIEDCNTKELLLIIEEEPVNICDMLEEAGYNNVEIFEAFGLLSEMVESCDDLKYHGIEEVSESESEGEGVKKINGRYYQY